jgi:alpha-tubulin suppressor-like RCC1 family protein
MLRHVFAALLAGCLCVSCVRVGYVDIIEHGGHADQGGDSYDGGDSPDADETPSVEVPLPGDHVQGDVVVPFVVRDSQSRIFTATLEYSMDETTWRVATATSASPTTAGISSSPAGDRHSFVWSSLADLGPADRSRVVLRVRISGPNGAGGEGRSPAVAVWNQMRVCVGTDHTCANTVDGRVLCFGYDGTGALGDGPADSSSKIVAVTGIADAMAVAAGESSFLQTFSCALSRDGRVRCWGGNERGQLGDGSNISRDAPVLVSEVGDAVDLTVGYGFACVLRTTGGVACWGRNDRGQLGNAGSADSNVPVDVLGIAGAMKVVASPRTAAGGTPSLGHTCALLAGGDLWCWGSNDEGELGNDDQATFTSPVQVEGIGAARDVGVGPIHTCVLLDDGSVSCWGSSAGSALGDGQYVGRTTAAPVVGVSGAERLFTGGFFSCALASGALTCWGLSDENQMLDSSLLDGRTAKLVTPPEPAEQVSSNSETVCMLSQRGKLYCWGQNMRGEKGTGGTETHTLPVSSVLAGSVSQLALAQGQACALDGGTVSCWGAGLYGALGDGTRLARASAKPVSGLSGATTVSVGANSTGALAYFACAVTTAGSVQCWGNGDAGRLGNNAAQDSPTPVPVSGLTGVTAIDLGGTFACARRSDGSVWCWGQNAAGLGDGTSTQSLVPVQVSGITTATDVKAGASCACALTGDHHVWCWGQGSRGQLGNGVMASSAVPVEVSGLTDATAIDVGSTFGYDHACALRSGNTVVCWGSNLYGALGSGTWADSSLPVSAAGLTSVTSIALGLQFSCALRGDGSVWCWGYGDGGALGNGSSSSSASAGPVTGIATAQAIFAGGDGACAKLASGNFVCWGNNHYSALPIGEDTFSPVQVSGLP